MSQPLQSIPVTKLSVDGDRAVYVSPKEFRELAVSHRPLVRIDDAAAGLRGLFDRDTQVRYLVDESRLNQYYAT